VLEELEGEPEFDVLRQDENPDRRVARADLDRRAQALVVVRRRQPDVDDRDVRRVAAPFEQKIVALSH